MHVGGLLRENTDPIAVVRAPSLFLATTGHSCQLWPMDGLIGEWYAEMMALLSFMADAKTPRRLLPVNRYSHAGRSSTRCMSPHHGQQRPKRTTLAVPTHDGRPLNSFSRYSVPSQLESVSSRWRWGYDQASRNHSKTVRAMTLPIISQN